MIRGKYKNLKHDYGGLIFYNTARSSA